MSLPTSGAWASLEVPPDAELHMAQVDVEAAFFRIDTPAGLDEKFILPRLHAQSFRDVRPD